jgi:hypothetical protein
VSEQRAECPNCGEYLACVICGHEFSQSELSLSLAREQRLSAALRELDGITYDSDADDTEVHRICREALTEAEGL